MAKADAASVDFTNVVELFKERGLLSPTSPPEMVSTAKSVHRCTYSLISWRFRLGKLPNRASVYLDEIASDALQILPQILSGYSKTAKLLMRGIVENTARHIYFFDHSVEFLKSNRAGKWHLTASALLEYVATHPEFTLIEKSFDGSARLSSLYSELSAEVHGRSVMQLEMRSALAKIIFDPSRAKKDVLLLTRCTEAVNFLISVFHQAKVAQFSPEDKRLIMRTMTPQAREAWKLYEPSAELQESRA